MPWPNDKVWAEVQKLAGEGMIYRVGHDSDFNFVKLALHCLVESQQDLDYKLELVPLSTAEEKNSGIGRMKVRTMFRGKQTREFFVTVESGCGENVA